MEGRPGSQEPARARARWSAGRRITAGDAIRQLFRRGKRSETPHLDVFASPSPAVRSRVALVVPLHGRTAVARNRLKRRLREIARTELLPRLDGRAEVVDILIRARARAYDARFGELRQELVRWTDRRSPGGPRSR